MTTFTYRAIDKKGSAISGVLEATDQRSADRILMDRGLNPIDISNASEHSQSWLHQEIGSAKPKRWDHAKFARMLAALLTAGVSLDRALAVMADNQSDRRLQSLSQHVLEGVASGAALSAVMADGKAGFLNADIGLIKSGEQTGQLALALRELSQGIERQVKLRERIISALVYPAILLVMAILSLVVIATVLAPSLAPVFAQAKQEPPVLLRIVSYFRDQAQVQFFIPLALALLWLFSRSATGASLLSQLKLALHPARQLEASRFARALGGLLERGTDLQTALKLAADTVLHTRSKQEILTAYESITRGGKLAASIKSFSALDATSVQLIKIGEETNQLPAMLNHIAESEENAATQTIERWMTVLTPLLTVLIGILIGGLIMSVMRAIFSLNDLALQ